MPVFNNALAGAAGSGGAAGYKIERSLRLNTSDSAHLSKNFSTSSNRKKWTYSTWVKRAQIGTEQMFGIERQSGNGAGYEYMRFDASDRIDLYVTHDGSNWSGRLQTTAAYRDTSAWMHVVLVCDIPNSTAGDRLRLYVNGERVTTFDASSYPATTEQTTINSTGNHHIGKITANSQYYGGYLAETYFLDGLAISTPEGVFGEFDEDTGIWNPIEYTRTGPNDGTTYISSATLNSGLRSSGAGDEAMFDGILPTTFSSGGNFGGVRVDPSTTNSSLTINLSKSVSGNVTIFPYYASSAASASITFSNNNTVNLSGSELNFGAVDLGTQSSFNSFTLDQTFITGGGSNFGIAGIAIDGVLLRDNSSVNTGLNDFYLDFDPDAADDYSGGGTWSGNTAGTSKTPIDLGNAFDGDITTYALHNDVEQVPANTDIVLNYTFPGTGVSVLSKLRVYVASYSHVSVNGGATEYSYSNTSGGEWIDISAAISGYNFKLTSLKIRRNIPAVGNYRAALAAVEVDGKILVDGHAPGVDASGAGNHWIANNIALTGISYGTTSNSAQSDANTYIVSDEQWSANANFPGNQAFDGNTNLTGTIGQVYFHAEAGYSKPVVSNAAGGVEAMGNGGGITMAINGGTQQPVGNGTWTKISGTFDGTLDSLNVYNNVNGFSYFKGIRVNGVDIAVRLRTDNPGDIDTFIDSPTDYEADTGNNGGNYCVLNTLTGTNTLSNGNLDVAGSTVSWKVRPGTIGVSSGKWYFEYTSTGNHDSMIGIGTADASFGSYAGADAYGYSYYASNGQKYNAGAGSSYGASWVSGDTIGVAFDADNGTLEFYKNGTSQGTAFTGIPSGTYFPMVSNVQSGSGTCNFGQRPFKYPPGGTGGPADTFKSVCTTNLVDSLITDGSTAFDVLTYSGSGYPDLTNPSQSLTGLSFSPDFVWAKARNATYSHGLFDSVRGPNKGLRTNGTNVETNDSANSSSLVSFDSNGFTVGPDAGAGSINYGGTTYAAWAWDGGNLASTSDTTNYNQSQTWSDDITTSNGWSAKRDGKKAFDGRTQLRGSSNTWAQVDTTGGTVTWTPNGYTIDTADVIYIKAISSTDRLTVVGSISTQSNIAPGTVNGVGNVYTVPTTLGTVTSLSVTNPNGLAGFSGIEVDGKILIDPGVITIGSLDSSFYNQDQQWSNGWTGNSGTSGRVPTNAFDGNLGTWAFAGNNNANEYVEYSFTAIDVNTSLEFYLSFDAGGAQRGELYVNDTDVTSQLGAGNAQWYTVTGFSTLSKIKIFTTATNYYVNLHAVRVDGKILVDNNVTPASIPSISATCRTNQTAGFSIVSWTGTGTAGTIPHNLNADPELLIFKNRTTAADWVVWHKEFAANERIRFNYHYEKGVDNGFSNATLPTSLLFSVGTTSVTNTNNDDYIGYCFSSVEGYSAIGYFEGDGQSVGPFVYTGFQPAFLLVKSADTGYDWFIYDTTRQSYNEQGPDIRANRNYVEANTDRFDLLSNGFKVHTSSVANNAANVTYIYAAFAEHPFKLARAR